METAQAMENEEYARPVLSQRTGNVALEPSGPNVNGTWGGTIETERWSPRKLPPAKRLRALNAIFRREAERVLPPAEP